MLNSAPPVGSTRGLLRVVGGQELNAQDQETARRNAEAQQNPTPAYDLSAHVRNQFMIFRNHRNQGDNPLNYRLLRAQRMFEGKYDPEKLKEIKKFGGSEVYSRLVAVKCRSTTSLLRDVYLGSERPWDIEPQDDPPVPPEIMANIATVVQGEARNLQANGQPAAPNDIHMRFNSLVHAAQQAARRNAMSQAQAASDKIEDILRAGQFYDALTQFLVDVPLYPFGCLKGPVVRMSPKLTWVGGRAVMVDRPQMFWERIDPFNLYWSPGASCIENADIIERKRLTRSDLNALIGLPGYDEAAVRAAIEDYDRGLRDWLDYPDTEIAFMQGRESPYLNFSQYIDAAEYHANLHGELLLAYGVDPKLIPDSTLDYNIQTWVVGRHTLKTQVNPSPRQRHPYYVTSFEKVPGTVAGHGLADILEDLQEICNANLRALVNNMGIASGPQVVVNTDRLAPTENPDDLYPWKRWYVIDDSMSNPREPITFFQPQSNAQELLQIYTSMSALADDVSAIPRYISGEGVSSGAGRTASGLSMLMNNAQKVLQTVAANIDEDVMSPLLTALYDMIMLTDTTGLLTGEEDVVVNGVAVAIQRETERQRQLQFLQITGNPIDAPIVGPLGRARVLRAVAQSLGLPDDIVPDDQTLQDQLHAQQQAQAATAAQAAANPQSQQPGNGQGAGPQQNPAAKAGAQAAGNQRRQPGPNRLSDHAPPFNAFQAATPQPGRQGIPINGQ